MTTTAVKAATITTVPIAGSISSAAALTSDAVNGRKGNKSFNENPPIMDSVALLVRLCGEGEAAPY